MIELINVPDPEEWSSEGVPAAEPDIDRSPWFTRFSGSGTEINRHFRILQGVKLSESLEISNRG